jgi:hypothetical protein
VSRSASQYRLEVHFAGLRVLESQVREHVIEVLVHEINSSGLPTLQGSPELFVFVRRA